MSDQPPYTYQPEPLAQTEEQVRARHQANRQSWNEAAARYTGEVEETISFLRAGGSNLHPIERANLSRLGTLGDWCHTAIHLQCASGRDTLSLWNEGVQQVVGVDISEVHIANASRTSEALNAPAKWYCCDVLDTPTELDGTADLVYTGRGALCWLHDLESWAAVICRLLKPGGVFHILDDHPVTWLFDIDAPTLTPTRINYFGYAESGRGWPSSYIPDNLGIPVAQQAVKYERTWTLAQIFTALRRTGLEVELLGEYPDPYWGNFTHLSPAERGLIPLTFAMMARKFVV